MLVFQHFTNSLSKCVPGFRSSQLRLKRSLTRQGRLFSRKFRTGGRRFRSTSAYWGRLQERAYCLKSWWKRPLRWKSNPWPTRPSRPCPNRKWTLRRRSLRPCWPWDQEVNPVTEPILMVKFKSLTQHTLNSKLTIPQRLQLARMSNVKPLSPDWNSLLRTEQCELWVLFLRQEFSQKVYWRGN